MQTIQWKKEVSEEIFRGLVIRARELGPIGFIHLKTDRGLIQIVLPKNIELPSIGCAVEVKGEVVPAKIKDPSLHFRQSEVQAVSMTILSAPSEVLPFEISKPELNINNDLLMDHRSLSLKHPKQTAIFVIKHWLLQGMREFLVEEGFIEIHTPKIVAEGAEGGANIFSLDYFGRKAYLAQSPQFYKEFCAGAFLKVFEVAPVFRAEKHNTSRHMNEYTSFDIEFGPLRSFEEIMALEVGMLKAGLAKLAKHAETELNLLKAKLPVVENIPVVSFSEAKKICQQAKLSETEEFDFSGAEERFLGEWIFKQTGSEFVFVTHYPSAVRPFYAKDDPTRPGETLSFDLLFRGMEITTGGQRIHEITEIENKMKQRGMETKHFDFFLNAHRHGLFPHGGLGLGLERLAQKILGLNSVKEASLFPRDQSRLSP